MSGCEYPLPTIARCHNHNLAEQIKPERRIK